MTPEIRLQDLLRNLGAGVLLLSGGVDSTALALAAGKVLGPGKLRLLTFTSPLMEEEELALARGTARHLRRPWTVLLLPALERPDIRNNPPDRCYHCKKLMHRRAREWQQKFRVPGELMDGVHREDRGEHRPGLRAAREDGVRHPLEEAEIPKELLRKWVRREGLPQGNRPPRPCLATRFPPGSPLEGPELRKIARGEALLRKRGFETARIRCFPPGAAVIEIPKEELLRAFEERESLVSALRGLGFGTVSLDLEGHLRGKMERFARKGPSSP